MYKILLAYDFSSMSDGALAWAARRIRQNGAVMKVVHVVTHMAELGTGAIPVPGNTELDRTRVEIQAAVARHNVDAEVQVIVGANPGGEIVIAANEFGADEIVMGTRGTGGLRRVLLGSVADHVVRHARCPVTTIRRGTAAAAPMRTSAR